MSIFWTLLSAKNRAFQKWPQNSSYLTLGPVHMSKKSPPMPAYLHPKTVLFVKNPGYLVNVLLHVSKA